VILAYAGRRAASLGGDIDRVAERIRRHLDELAPSAVVGAAADGADLLVLEAALGEADRPEIHVVLPTSREVFTEDSVEPAWRHRLAAVLDEVEGQETRGTVRSLDLEPGEAAYQAANEQFLNTALALDGGPESVVVLVVAREGEGQMVEHLVEMARVRGIPSVRIDPST
jgi:hypothetical protein